MDTISMDELFELIKQDRITLKPLKSRLKDFANGDPQRIRDIKSRCDYFIMTHKNEQDCRMLKDTVEEVMSELKH